MRMTKKTLSTAILAGSALLLAAGTASAQSIVNLTALRQTALMPDGNVVPMWGWLCGNPAATTAGGTGTAAASGGAICSQTNGAAQSIGTTAPSAVWQPPLIVVPYTASSPGVSTTGLTINLTNNLPVPTSLTIVGQLPNLTAADPNGPGNPARESGRPQHDTQTATTWTTGVTGQAPFAPPSQGPRAQAFVKEAVATTGTITYTWTSLAPGTYLIESGSYPSIQGPMGLYGVLVVTNAPTGAGTTFAAGTAYPSPAGAVTTTGVPYDADGVLLLSEIDAVQNQAADTAVRTTGFSPFTKWSPACSPSGPAATASTCYPPTVDYTPTYYLIDGHSFDRTNPALSALSVGSNDSTGTVLLRFVNAGLRMHMPSVIGLQMALIAEDGHLQPDVVLALTKTTAALTTCPSGNALIVGACPKVQNDWFMAAGKVLDIAVKPAGTTGGNYSSAYYPTFDRQLSLSTNNERDGGMQAYVLINAGTPTLSTTGAVTGYSNVPQLAAVTGAAGELFFPALLFIGLFSRIGALGAFFVNAMAVISYRQVLLAEGFEQRAHPVRLEPQRDLELVRRHRLEVVRPLEPRRTVESSPSTLNQLEVFVRADVCGALKKHMLEQMREAGTSYFLVGRSNVVPQVHCYDRSCMIFR